MLELAILGLLKERAMHGYELKRQLTLRLGHFWQVSFGSLYPTLKRLEAREAIVSRASTEYLSRRKLVYGITERGEAEFLTLIEERAHTTWEEDKFPLRFTFFRYLTPAMRIRLLERRKAYLVERLDDLRVSIAESRDRYTLSLLRHSADGVGQDIGWLDEMIAAERVLLEEDDRRTARPPSRTATSRTTARTSPRTARVRDRDIALPKADVESPTRAAARSRP